MLTSLTVVGATEADNIDIPVLGANPKDSYRLETVTGLGPPDGTLFIGDYSHDGGVYTGRRYPTRNPIFTIDCNPDYSKGETVSSLRDKLHIATLSSPSDAVVIVLHDDIKEDRVLVGYVEKFTAEPFGQDTSAQISMICPDPFIRSYGATSVYGSYASFPFTYKGTAAAGFQATVKMTVDSPILTLDINGSTMVFNYPFYTDDEIQLNTMRGQRTVTLTRATDAPVDIMYALDDASPWLTLHDKANTLAVYGTDSSNYVAAVTQMTFKNAYWGV